MYSDIGTTFIVCKLPVKSHCLLTLAKHRLLHIHQNIPGILGQINQILSENSINISGQYLQTNESVGYVVIDVDAEHSDMAHAEDKRDRRHHPLPRSLLIQPANAQPAPQAEPAI